MWKRLAFLSSFRLASSTSLGDLYKASYSLKFYQLFSTESRDLEDDCHASKIKLPWITFVLGGPGTGKGTQCQRISQTFGFTHLSAGDLLRKEMSSNSKDGKMISALIKEGNIVPSEMTVRLLQEAIKSSQSCKFLIDGFPRCNENRVAFEKIIGVEPLFVLFLDCPEDIMVARVLGRNEGRLDDNLDTVKKRLEVFSNLNLPVINYYYEKGKVQRISALGTVDEVFEKIRPLFSSFSRFQKKEEQKLSN
ncbi:Adenylate kinase, UMP/CMP kinase [Zostera marina]|uniref:adenylate kinase n=1 Tax=Zostera marina TaxID=29655 RepID=A0A0K9NYQ6_ZOSMR|nr:Adenylate kinase, UMP/CMP kinase [Zostera marina]